MGIQEQRAGKMLSYCATAFSVLLALYMYNQGKNNPRMYLASMNINHHNEYGGGAGLACSECHLPAKGVLGINGGPITCYTSYCHGELLPNYTHEESVEAYKKSKPDENFLPHFAAQTEQHLALHKAVKGQDCLSCHTEHTERELTFPEGFVPFESIKHQFQSSLQNEAIKNQTVALAETQWNTNK